MMRFYGMSLKQYRTLTMEDCEGLWQAITVLEAREELLRLHAMDWPNTKKEHRNRRHRELKVQGYPPHLSQEVQGRQVSTAEFAAFIASGGKKRG